ncbi:MAG: 2OG-Fe(II) oxygenase [Xanthobacteraceae bacterium]
MPPYLFLPDFLETRIASDVLAYTLAHERMFEPTRVVTVMKIAADPATRLSLGMDDLGPFKPILKSRILRELPALVAKLRASPIVTPGIELQLVAHNDGAFFSRHVDTNTSSERKHVRVLSGVYYFHRNPKAFRGGALRLFAVGNREHHVDIEPVNNTLLVFPSWTAHEVRPVSCPSRRFIDSRFSINCWVYRAPAKAA